MVVGQFEYKAQFLARLWLAFPLRRLLPLLPNRQWSLEVPGHFRRVVLALKDNSWMLEREALLDHRALYMGIMARRAGGM